MKLKLFLML